MPLRTAGLEEAFVTLSEITGREYSF